MILDYLAGASLIILCAISSLIHYISSPKRTMWFTPPAHFRRTLLLCAAMFLWRGVDFFSLPPTATLGHTNSVGVMSFIALVTFAVSGMTWALPARLKNHAWERMRDVFWQLHHNPHLRPVLVDANDITEIAHAMGQAAVGENATPCDVEGEGPRYAAAVARSVKPLVADAP